MFKASFFTSNVCQSSVLCERVQGREEIPVVGEDWVRDCMWEFSCRKSKGLMGSVWGYQDIWPVSLHEHAPQFWRLGRSGEIPDITEEKLHPTSKIPEKSTQGNITSLWFCKSCRVSHLGTSPNIQKITGNGKYGISKGRLHFTHSFPAVI